MNSGECAVELVCDFCGVNDQVDPGMTPEYLRLCRDTNRMSRLVLLFEQSFAIVALGPIRPGNVVLFARNHATSLRDIVADSFLSLERNLALLEAKLTVEFGTFAIFEHGNVGGDSATLGGCVEHAHLQLMPSGVDETGESLLPDVELHEVENLSAVRDLDPRSEYLYIRDARQRHWVAQARRFEGQKIRRAYANLDGIDDLWNWRAHPRCDVIRATVDRLGSSDWNSQL